MGAFKKIRCQNLTIIVIDYQILNVVINIVSIELLFKICATHLCCLIFRYTGDDDDTCNPNEEELRNKFLQKIKDRKRNSEVLLENNDALNVKHKKKKKSLDEDEAVVQKDIKKKKKLLENIHDEDEAVVQKSKKKKKKSDGNIHVEELSNTDEEKAKKKKSKKQKRSDPIEDEAHQPDQEDEEIENEVKPNTENQTAFTILKDSQMCKKEKVKRRLPDWLANPSVVSVDLQNLTKTVDSIPGLDKIFVDKLRKNNITHFFPGLLYFSLIIIHNILYF